MPLKAPTRWDREADVVVAGSGAAGLTAAILAHDRGARVIVLERAPLLGGTSAISGGILWIPLNDHLAEVGITDSREEALTYLRRVTLGLQPDDHLLEVFVDRAAEMLRYLEAHTPLRVAAIANGPDYHAEFPGGKSGGRCVDQEAFETGERLGEWAQKLRRSPMFPPLTKGEAAAKYDHLGINWTLVAERYERDVRTMGGALMSALLRAVLDREIEVLLETRARDLVENQQGEIVGLRAEQSGADSYAGATQAVILATGGFEWNPELVKTFLKGQVTHPNTPPYNEGDGLLMAMDAGALLGNMSEAWWVPSLADPDEAYDGRPLHRTSGGDRSLPGSILVNRKGRRFVNEATDYNDLTKTLYSFDPVDYAPANLPAWLIFDQTYKNTYAVMTAMPGEDAPHWMTQAPSIGALAEQIGVDGEGLTAQVARFNEFARVGRDPDFHRGEFRFDHSNGDPRRKPNPNLAPLEAPPFYAVQVHLGALGTKGGPRTNAFGQALDVRSRPIPGLYAVGNVMASIMGPGYPGAGASLGPAMTFGYLAGIEAAAAPKRAISESTAAANPR